MDIFILRVLDLLYSYNIYKEFRSFSELFKFYTEIAMVSLEWIIYKTSTHVPPIRDRSGNDYELNKYE